MKQTLISLLFMAGTLAAEIAIDPASIDSAFAQKNGGVIFINAADGEELVYSDSLVRKRTTPCSTFKIWNALLGIRRGILSSPDQPFWTWDSISRDIVQWNKDLTLREAFQVSCVPAFQNLARTIGQQQMKAWIDSLDYGNRDMSSGLDDFWLPRAHKRSITISPREQAVLLQKLVTGKIPVDASAVKFLRELMKYTSTGRGTLYSKTGTGSAINGVEGNGVGWYVGFVESQGKTVVFAAILNGNAVSGADVRGIVETILTRNGLL